MPLIELPIQNRTLRDFQLKLSGFSIKKQLKILSSQAFRSKNVFKTFSARRSPLDSHRNPSAPLRRLFPVVLDQVEADRTLQAALGREEVLLPGLQQVLLGVERPEVAPEEVSSDHRQEHQAKRSSHSSNLVQHQHRRRRRR